MAYTLITMNAHTTKHLDNLVTRIANLEALADATTSRTEHARCRFGIYMARAAQAILIAGTTANHVRRFELYRAATDIRKTEAARAAKQYRNEARNA